MADLTLDLPDDLLDRIQATATARGVSLDAYIRGVLEAEAISASRAEFIAKAAAIAEHSRGRPQTDSAEIIRRSRDSNWNE